MTRSRRFEVGLNWAIIVPVVSAAVGSVALGMAACALYAALGDGREVGAFAFPAAVLLPVTGIALRRASRLRSRPFRPRDGYLAVTLAWLLAAVAGAVPFLLSDALPRPIDAFFESMSGFTTTGSTLFGELEPQAGAVLLWRSLTQWLGGVGIVVLVVAIAPATGLASSRIFFAETSGVTSERLTPRIADTAKIIVGIYLALTGLGFVAYVLAGMGVFDAVNHIFTTLATGGFSTRTASIAGFDSLPIELVAIAFMAAAGVNFAFYWRAIRGESLWPQAAEVRLYLLVLAGGILAVTVSLVLSDLPGSWSHQLRSAAFSVTSVMTSTGYTTDDFDGWNDFARTALLVLMVIGGCAGSTSGGMKVIRVQLLARTGQQEVERQLRPKAVQVLRTGGRNFSEDVRRGVLGFFFVYVSLVVAGTLAMLASGLDVVSAFSSIIATLNMVGPGLGQVGATDNFAAVSDGGLGVLTFFMLAGRLEIFTVLVLLTPAFWRPSVA